VTRTLLLLLSTSILSYNAAYCTGVTHNQHPYFSFVTHCLRNMVVIKWDKRSQISNLWRNGFRLSLNFRRRHRLVDEITLIFVAVFVTLTKLSELSSQFSSRQRKLKWLRQWKFPSSSSLTKNTGVLLWQPETFYWSSSPIHDTT